MNVTLVVVRPFGSHARGDLVSDPTQIAQILGSEHAGSVVRVSMPAAPAAAAGAASAIGSPAPAANASGASGKQTPPADAASTSGNKEG